VGTRIGLYDVENTLATTKTRTRTPLPSIPYPAAIPSALYNKKRRYEGEGYYKLIAVYRKNKTTENDKIMSKIRNVFKIKIKD
jgi:hypothetical protein